MSWIKIASLLAVVLILMTATLSCKPSGTMPPLSESAPSVSEEGQGDVTPEMGAETSDNQSEPRFVGPPANQVLDMPEVDFPELSSSDITAIKNLVGTWRGRGVSFWVDGDSGERVARTTWDVTLIINQQLEDNTVGGTLTMTTVEQESLVPQNFPIQNYGPDPITNGKVEGTSLYFDVTGWEWSFTFTTDLMSGQYTTPGEPGIPCDAKAFVLSRQR